MSYTELEWNRAIVNLIKATKESKATWNSYKIEISDLPIGYFEKNSFRSKISGLSKIYFLTEAQYKYFTDEDEWHWSPAYFLTIYNESFNSAKIAQHQIDTALGANLLSSILDSIASQNDALDDLLNL